MFRFGDPGGRIYQNVGTSNANLFTWWTTGLVGNMTPSVQAGGGRLGSSSLRLTWGNSSFAAYISKTLDAQPTWGVAMAVRLGGLPGNNIAVGSFYDAATLQCDLRINTDGTLSITRNGTVLGTTSAAISPNIYAHLEFKVTINATTGSAGLWVNGVQRLNLSGVNTKNSSNAFANIFVLGPVNNGPQTTSMDFDDIVVYDGQATDALGNADITGPIGDCRLAVVPPSGAGAVTQFTALGTSPNYNCLIDANGPDGDSTCVQSGTVGQTDTYVTGGLPAYATVVKAVAVVEYARKTDAGVRTLSPVIRSGGGNSVHPTANTLGTNYQYFFNNWGQNPNNGSPTAWTQAGVNAIEIGQQVSG